MKWNAGVLGHIFLQSEGWIGPETAWANKVKFLWNLPQSSIEPATFYSVSSALPLDHGGPLKDSVTENEMKCLRSGVLGLFFCTTKAELG